MKIAVCILVYNEEKNILAVLQNILAQNLVGHSLKIIVVSSGSIDNTNMIVLNYSKQGFPIQLLIEEERSGKGNAINLLLPILHEEKPDISIFTDGDVFIAPNGLDFLMQKLGQNNLLSTVTGHPMPSQNLNNFWLKIAHENCAIWNDVREFLEVSYSVWPLSGYLFAVRTVDLPSNIPARLVAEDAFIGLELFCKGKKMGYETNAIVKVKYPMNIMDYYNQKSRTRSGWFQVQKFAPKEMKSLRRLQRKVIFLRIQNGHYLSLICYLLDNLIWLMDQFFTRNNANRHLWKSVKSTK